MSPLLRTSRYFAPKFKNFIKQPSSLTNLLFKSSISTISTTNPAFCGGEEPSRLGPPPIRVGFTESAGRGVFSTRRIGAGELIHTDNPVVSHPFLGKNDVVCYLCLRRLKPRNCFEHDHGEIEPFCSEECREKSKAFYELETRADWSVFHKYCRTHGLKYPLLVKRLACMVIGGAASANCIDVLQPAQILPEIEEEHILLRSALEAVNTTKESLNFLSSEWYANVLARIRINSFRIEMATGLYEDLLSSALASVVAEAGVGNAVYILSSFYNHDCDPNVHILWIDNVRARLKALREIEVGMLHTCCFLRKFVE
ncbi:hypothetical protein RND81_09G009300 [Saponaria officinalis]|uniref:SET domain-containing protein n=1 Tax=Saponaria officinalis TaxID=3572 RepID=A0AAW1IHC4_SAPOF